MPRSGAVEAEAAPAQADVPAPADNEVVEDADVEQLAGLDQFGRDRHVLGRGRRVAGGVVVRDDDRRRVLLQRFFSLIGFAEKGRLQTKAVANGRLDLLKHRPTHLSGRRCRKTTSIY